MDGQLVFLDARLHLVEHLPGDLHIAHGVGQVGFVQLSVHPVLRLKSLVDRDPQLPVGDGGQAVLGIGLTVASSQDWSMVLHNDRQD